MTTAWTTAGLLAALSLSTMGCGSDDVGQAGPAPEISVDICALDLSGPIMRYESERRAVFPNLLRAQQTDVLCLVEVFRDQDKDDLIEAVKDRFPYSYYEPVDRATPVDDPSAADGTIPTAYATPPCGTPDLQALAQEVIDCAVANCSTIPGDDGGHVTELSCASTQCAASYVPFLAGGGMEERRCMSCIEAGLDSESTFSHLRDDCYHDPQAGFIFNGQSDALVLSRYPIDRTRARRYVLPSSLTRRQVLLAPVEVGGTQLDVYCTSTSTIYSGVVVYPGQYGDGATGNAAWANENLLQTTKAAAFVRDTSGSRPALVAALLKGSKSYEINGTAVVSANLGAPSIAEFESQFALGVPPDYVPVCTFCPEDVLAEVDPPGEWSMHIWLHNLDASHVLEAHRPYAERIVEVQPTDGVDLPPDHLIHASQHFGLRARLRLGDE